MGMHLQWCHWEAETRCGLDELCSSTGVDKKQE